MYLIGVVFGTTLFCGRGICLGNPLLWHFSWQSCTVIEVIFGQSCTLVGVFYLGNLILWYF